ncbi:SMI1/KNR4 family protein [Mycolicibacterium sp. 624]|uniref:SMI1/KNR4 family protein n=1 Tax=Mycolicibacterium sp. 624 TaxID=3156314 RepID=UPI0033910195
MATLRDLSTWLPALEAQLRHAPTGVDVVEFRGSLGPGGAGGTLLMDGKSQQHGALINNTPNGNGTTDRSHRDVFHELFAIAKRFEVERAGVVLRSSRSGLREVDLIELPACVEDPDSGAWPLPGVLVLKEGALPGLYRRQPDLTITVAPALGADPAALSRLIAQQIPDATPADAKQLAAVEAQLGVPLTDEVRAIYLTAGSGNIRCSDGSYGMEIIPLDDIDTRHSFKPEPRKSVWWYAAAMSLGPDPAGRIQPLGWSPLWFPVGHDSGGNIYAADLAPAQRGHRGQVVFLDHECPAGATYYSESFTELLVHGRTGDLSGPVEEGTTASIEDWNADTEVLGIGGSDSPVDLGPLLDHPRIHAIYAAAGALADPQQLTRFPALDYVAMGAAEWRILLDAGLVPPQLLAAEISDGDHDLAATVMTANDLLGLCGRPLIEMTRMRGWRKRPLVDRLREMRWNI